MTYARPYQAPQLGTATNPLPALHRRGHSVSMAEQSINIPQVIVFIFVTFLAVRWYLSKPAADGTRAGPNRSAARINPALIDQVAHMFPQLSRRDIAWDLQRNGGNVAATTERALGGRGLAAVSFTASGHRLQGDVVKSWYRHRPRSASLHQGLQPPLHGLLYQSRNLHTQI